MPADADDGFVDDSDDAEERGGGGGDNDAASSSSASSSASYFSDSELFMSDSDDDRGGGGQTTSSGDRNSAPWSSRGPCLWSQLDLEDMDVQAARLASLSLTAASAQQGSDGDGQTSEEERTKAGAAIHAVAAAAAGDDFSVAHTDLLQLGELDAQRLTLVRPDNGAAVDDGASTDAAAEPPPPPGRKLSAAARPRVMSTSVPPGLASAPTADLQPSQGNAAEALTSAVSPASPAFDPVAYMWHVHRDTPFADVKRGQAMLETSLARQNDMLRRLVKANFDRFIRCRDTIADISAKLAVTERDFFGGDDGKQGADSNAMVSALRGWKGAVDEEFSTLLSLQKRLDHLKSLQASMARRRALFQFPETIRELAIACKYEEVVSELGRARRMLVSQQTDYVLLWRMPSGISQLGSSEAGSSPRDQLISPRSQAKLEDQSDGKEQKRDPQQEEAEQQQQQQQQQVEEVGALEILLEDVEEAASALAEGLRCALSLGAHGDMPDNQTAVSLSAQEAVRAAMLLYQIEIAPGFAGVLPANAPVATSDPIEVHLHARAANCVRALRDAFRVEDNGDSKVSFDATSVDRDLGVRMVTSVSAVDRACELLSWHLEGLWAVHSTFISRDAVREAWGNASAEDGTSGLKGLRSWKSLRSKLVTNIASNDDKAESVARYFHHRPKPSPREFYEKCVVDAVALCSEAFAEGVVEHITTIRSAGLALLEADAVSATLATSREEGGSEAMARAVANLSVVLDAVHRTSVLLTEAAERLPSPSGGDSDSTRPGLSEAHARLAVLAGASAGTLCDLASSFAVLRVEYLHRIALQDATTAPQHEGDQPAAGLSEVASSLRDCVRWDRLLDRVSHSDEDPEAKSRAIPYGGTLALTLHCFDVALDLSASAYPAIGILKHWHDILGKASSAGQELTRVMSAKGMLSPIVDILPPSTFERLQLHARATTRVLPRLPELSKRDRVSMYSARWHAAHLHILGTLRETLQSLADNATKSDTIDAARTRMLCILDAAATASRSADRLTALCLYTDVPYRRSLQAAQHEQAEDGSTSSSWQASLCSHVSSLPANLVPLPCSHALWNAPRDARTVSKVAKQLEKLEANLAATIQRVFGGASSDSAEHVSAALAHARGISRLVR